jgi:hypothetical protein
MTQKKLESQKPDLIMAIDFGGSLTKIIATTGNHLFSSECMEPYVIEVEGNSIIEYENHKLGLTTAINRAWLKVESNYYAVGYLAKSRFLASTRLSQLKYEQGLYKTLAAIWVFQQKWQLSKQLKVALACLLPPGEWKDSQRFQQRLSEAAVSFETPDGVLEVEITHFNCKPEGAGIFMMHRAKRGENNLQRLVSAVVMLGYRNASVMLSRRGEVGEFVTSPLGFIQLVKGVMRRTSGYQEDYLAQQVAIAGDTIREQPLRKLIRSSDSRSQEEEMRLLRQSIQEARGEYVTQLKTWLTELLPKELDEVIVCGGTADYLCSELQEYWQNYQIFWHAEIKIPEQLLTASLGNRLADVWSLFCYFCDQFGLKFKRRRNRKKARV